MNVAFIVLWLGAARFLDRTGGQSKAAVTTTDGTTVAAAATATTAAAATATTAAAATTTAATTAAAAAAAAATTAAAAAATTAAPVPSVNGTAAAVAAGDAADANAAAAAAAEPVQPMPAAPPAGATGMPDPATPDGARQLLNASIQAAMRPGLDEILANASIADEIVATTAHLQNLSANATITAVMFNATRDAGLLHQELLYNQTAELAKFASDAVNATIMANVAPLAVNKTRDAIQAVQDSIAYVDQVNKQANSAHLDALAAEAHADEVLQEELRVEQHAQDALKAARTNAAHIEKVLAKTTIAAHAADEAQQVSSTATTITFVASRFRAGKARVKRAA